MIQIDVIDILPQGNVVCNLYTPNRCVMIVMSKPSYEALVEDKFFIRDGKEKDSADVINTTATYRKEGEK